MGAGGIAELWQTGRDVLKITGFLGGLFSTCLPQAGRHDEQAKSRESHVMIELSSFLLVAGGFSNHSDVKNRQNQSRYQPP